MLRFGLYSYEFIKVNILKNNWQEIFVLRKLIKSIIPSKGDVFFNLFEELSTITHESAQILVNILEANDSAVLEQLAVRSKILKQSVNEINKRVLIELNKMFITPIDRGDIQELSGILHKLTKRTLKIGTKLRIYNIDAKTDDCLIKNANTLLMITKYLMVGVSALKTAEESKVVLSTEKINELEENGIEDFRHAINEIFSGKFDNLTILKLKEIYKSIDAAIELSVSAAELIMQISFETI